MRERCVLVTGCHDVTAFKQCRHVSARQLLRGCAIDYTQKDMCQQAIIYTVEAAPFQHRPPSHLRSRSTRGAHVQTLGQVTTAAITSFASLTASAQAHTQSLRHSVCSTHTKPQPATLRATGSPSHVHDAYSAGVQNSTLTQLAAAGSEGLDAVTCMNKPAFKPAHQTHPAGRGHSHSQTHSRAGSQDKTLK